MSDQPVAVATCGDAPSVDEQAAGQASAAAGAAAVHEDQAAAAAAQSVAAAEIAAANAAQTEGAGESAAAAQAAAEQAMAARDDMDAGLSAFRASMSELAEAIRGTHAEQAPPPPETAPEPAAPDKPPARKEHWINRKVGGKRT